MLGQGPVGIHVHHDAQQRLGAFLLEGANQLRQRRVGHAAPDEMFVDVGHQAPPPVGAGIKNFGTPGALVPGIGRTRFRLIDRYIRLSFQKRTGAVGGMIVNDHEGYGAKAAVMFKKRTDDVGFVMGKGKAGDEAFLMTGRATARKMGQIGGKRCHLFLLAKRCRLEDQEPGRPVAGAHTMAHAGPGQPKQEQKGRMLRYRILMTLAWLAVPFVFVLRLMRGKDSAATFAARLGFGRRRTGRQPVIWLHAASVGELNTLVLLLPPLGARFPEHELLITVSNRIAFGKAREMAGEKVHAAIAPLDLPSAVGRFLRRWRPVLAITLENEIYPIRIEALARTRVPIMHVNARMSERSHAAWARHRPFARRVFGHVRHCFAQDPASAERFADLGVPPGRIEVIPNLKRFQTGAPPDHPDLAHLLARWPRKRTICAASTHRGEDETLIAAYARARAAHPGLKLILVPRHPNRAGEIARLLQEAELTFAIRSKNERPTARTDVLLADTVGEMALWYAASAITFVAGSLLPIGGHTPYEPAAFGSAITHGPHYANFREAYSALLENGGSVQAENAERIAEAWGRLLNPATRTAQVDTARRVLLEGEDRTRTFSRITDTVAALLPSDSRAPVASGTRS